MSENNRVAEKDREEIDRSEQVEAPVNFWCAMARSFLTQKPNGK